VLITYFEKETKSLLSPEEHNKIQSAYSLPFVTSINNPKLLPPGRNRKLGTILKITIIIIIVKEP
jgi:hypothetical protein